MALTRAVVLQSPIYNNTRLSVLVERCLDDGVDLIAIAGRNSFKLEAEVDSLIVGDGSRPDRFICTSAHPSYEGEDGIGEALCLAGSFGRSDGTVDQIFLLGDTWLKYRSALEDN